MNKAELARILEEVRFEMGVAGVLNDTLDNSMWWTSKSGELARSTDVVISPGADESRIRVKDDNRNVRDMLLAQAAIVTPMSFLIGGAILNSMGLSTGGTVAGAAAIGATVLGANLAAVRAWFRRSMSRRREFTRKLAKRIEELLAEEND